MPYITGSSPLARGTCCGDGCLHCGLRLIPARAGNIVEGLPEAKSQPAHPRSRGEHFTLLLVGLVDGGSSPLARGTSFFLDSLHVAGRLIPARAGNIYDGPENPYVRAAHPRSRGEHIGCAWEGGDVGGSSPLARGTSANRLYFSAPARLIPARAGNILADMGVYPLHQQNRITLKPEPHPGYTINSHS